MVQPLHKGNGGGVMKIWGAVKSVGRFILELAGLIAIFVVVIVGLGVM